MAQCTAHSKRTGERCKAEAMAMRTVCRMHGGTTPRGMAAPSYKHGRYSKDLPTRLAGQYEEHLKDPDLVSLNRELALIDTRAGEILRALRDAEPLDEVWEKLQRAMDRFKRAEAEADPELARRAIRDMESLIVTGAEQGDYWGDVFKLTELRRKTVETEAKRLQIAHQIITVDQLMLMVGLLANIVRGAVLTYVSDTTVSRRILTQVQTAIDRDILGGIGAPATAGDPAVADGVLEQREEEAVYSAS